MPGWNPIAVLPNLSIDNAVDGGVLAIANSADARVQTLCKELPKFADFLSRFANAFGVALDPAVIIGRDNVSLEGEAILSFRDLVAISVIPHCRSLNSVYGTSDRIVYSESFWIYPWILSKDNHHLTMANPALTGIHFVEAFHGQSLPEVPVVKLRDFDTPLFDALIGRWKRHYFGKRKKWKDRALFRSLNMAVQAASLPAAVGTSIFDLGRSAAMWVSAFEILSHPRIAKADLLTVYSLFESVKYCDKHVGRRKYAANTPNWKKAQNRKNRTKEPRRSLPCWIYNKLYNARNAFLHGEPVSLKTLNPAGTKGGLFWPAPSLYRLALGGFLDLTVTKDLPYWLSAEYGKNPKLRKLREISEAQEVAERALLRVRVSRR